VDDEEVVTDFIQLALSSRGFVVDCACNGEEACGMAGQNPYDLIITDLRMPGEIDGRELFFKLKSENPDLADRFVFISGNVADRGTEEFLKKSGRAFLLKPFSIHALRAVVSKSLEELSS
jgi:two-component system NtrC family sensor kinase